MEDFIIKNNKVAVKDDNGNINLDNLKYDKEAVKDFFINNINKHTRFFYSLEEKLDYLVSHDYWYDFTEYYSMEFIKDLFKLIYSKKFRFQSFMAASKFYQSYALKDDDGETYLERYEDRVCCTALYLARGNEDDAVKFAELMINQVYQPATPTFLNAGRKRSGELVSCFLDELSDSMSGISYSVDESLRLSSIGGGVGLNLSKLRAKGEPIKGVNGRGSGVMPVAKIFDDVFTYANQLGQRSGAGALYLNIFHADVFDFLDSKKLNSDEKLRLKTISLGLIVPDKFIELVYDNKPFYTFNPYSVKKEYCIDLDDMNMSEWYDRLVEEGKAVKFKSQLTAREFLTSVAQVQKESGYPYLFFKDNANKSHALRRLGSVNFSNLCTEIMQLSSPSDPYGYNRIPSYGYGISCVLGSLNLVNLIQGKDIQQSVRLAMRMLTNVSDLTRDTCEDKLPPSIYKSNQLFHSVGLGAMNLHGLFAISSIPFESREAKDLVNIIFYLINYYSIVSSMEIAQDKNESFHGFEESDYYSGEYFKNYSVPIIKTDKVKEVLEGIYIPTQKDWDDLADKVRSNGMYHAYRLAIAPNQSTGYIMNATPSIMPISTPIETRVYENSTTYYPMPYLSYETLFAYKSVYDMDQVEVLKLVAVIQRHIDQGISTIIHANSETTTSDLVKYYISAHKLGLKSLYYTRVRKSYINSADELECVSCSV